jgi:hypothetical protein
MLGGSAYRGILQFGVDAVVVVVIDIFAEKASKGVLVQDDHVIHLERAGPKARPPSRTLLFPDTSNGDWLCLDRLFLVPPPH